MEQVFLGIVTIAGVYAVYHYIKSFIGNLTKSFEFGFPRYTDKKRPTGFKKLLLMIVYIIDSAFRSLFNMITLFGDKKFLGFVASGIGILIFFSILPYISNLNDQASVEEAQSNIELFEDYSDTYAEAAQQQIEDYAEMQQEMSRRATVEQLSFWSEQQDEIGNKLSEQIRDYQVKIEEQELEINMLEARVQSRLNNKWYFYLDE